MEKLKNRQELARLFADKNFIVGAEIGVCNGYFSRTICELNPQLKNMFGIDNWSDQAKSHSSRNKDDKAYAMAMEVLKPFIDENRYTIIREKSLDAVKHFKDEVLDYVYIDAGHTYEDVKDDIESWTPKVRAGGIVSGHDYYEFPSGKGGVIPAVNEYVAKHGYTLHVTEWDKENEDRDSRQPSWFFIKGE